MPDQFSVPTAPPVPMQYWTKSELVYQQLGQGIVSGTLAPGTRLYLDEIAQRLGVSTNPVREALRRLVSEGLIANRPHLGAVVASIDREAIEAHFLIRSILEGLAVRLAAALATSADLAALDALDQQLRQLVAAHDDAAWDERNLTFYRLLFSLSHAAELIALIDLQRDRSPRYRYFPAVLRQRTQEADAGRRAVLDALRTGDGERAERLHRANVAHVGQLLSRAMRPAGTNHPAVGTAQARAERGDGDRIRGGLFRRAGVVEGS